MDGMLETSKEIVERFVAGYAPNAPVVLLAGSRARGGARENSDYDVVLLFANVKDGAWREMVAFEDALIEVFAHDLETLPYFLREVERPSAKPVLGKMIVEGVPVVMNDGALLDGARTLARQMISAGPEKLDEAKIQAHRYALTNLAETLRGKVGPAERMAISSALYVGLSEFALRAKGKWTASGKAMPEALDAMDHELARKFTSAFATLAMGEPGMLQELVDDVLAPYGGRLRAGYTQQAPADWRDAAVVVEGAIIPERRRQTRERRKTVRTATSVVEG